MQAGPAGDDRLHPTALEIVEHTSPDRLKLRHAERLRRFNQVNEVMRDAPLQRGGHLGRSDVHPSIDLHRVNADDLATDEFSERNRDFGLPCRSRPENGRDGQLALAMR